MKLTARDLLDLEVVDDIVPEPFGGAHQNHAAAIENLKVALLRHLEELRGLPVDDLLAKRYEKFRRVGEFADDTGGAGVDEAAGI